MCTNIHRYYLYNEYKVKIITLFRKLQKKFLLDSQALLSMNGGKTINVFHLSDYNFYMKGMLLVSQFWTVAIANVDIRQH
jgi:hypothetical protein